MRGAVLHQRSVGHCVWHFEAVLVQAAHVVRDSSTSITNSTRGKDPPLARGANTSERR